MKQFKIMLKIQKLFYLLLLIQDLLCSRARQTENCLDLEARLELKIHPSMNLEI